MIKDKKVKLADYSPYPFAIPEISLDFCIKKKLIDITSSMTIKPKNNCAKSLLLKGENIIIKSLKIDSILIDKDKYTVNGSELEIKNIPENIFKLEIKSELDPYNNASLEGLYSSCDIITTQCEAEGFRRICFHPDRPDVLSKYTVRIEADKKKYPILLSNGNKIFESKLKDDPTRHEVVWEDPFPKPSYLFALVAGKLNKVSSSYKTKSGKIVEIFIYVEPGDEKFTDHAIKSLKRAMKWDEEIYKLEYDLKIFNIVAIRHFNMGAMENKSLNIFNSKLVLADSSIATDPELERIESVIAHEYFHNWTGNRITCRDWFQLSLKEGLTVFRDQTFTSDIHSESIKRIEDVSLLRNIQFKEDSGPTSHPVKPKEYLAIDNFYTTTIYEKGAEVIRILQTLLGKENYFKGIANYINKFDGTACTTEDFVYSVFEGALKNGYKAKFDIEQFIEWYNQPGTPSISIRRFWNSDLGQLKLSINQSNDNKYSHKKIPLVIPIEMAIICNNKIKKVDTLILDKKSEEFTFKNLPKNSDKPIISLFRNFSAPVNWISDLTIDEQLSLIRNDNDLFTIWNTFQLLTKKAIIARADEAPDSSLESSIIKALSSLIDRFGTKNPGFLSLILDIPKVSELELYQNQINPIALKDSYEYFLSKISRSLKNDLQKLFIKYKSFELYEWPKGQYERKLIEKIMSIRIHENDDSINNEILEFVKGESMTLAKASLNALININCKERNIALDIFYKKWNNNPVILDTWFNLKARIPENSISDLQDLISHPLFDPIAPNSIRAVMGGVIQNISVFHSKDGSGYIFIADQIKEIDSRNPITASRLLKIFSKWQNYSQPYRKHMFDALMQLKKHELSNNTTEVIELILK